MRTALYALLLVAGVASVPFIGSFGPLPTTALLDMWVIAFIAVMLLRGRTSAILLVALLTAYLLTRVVPALATEAPLQDFFQAYRWVVYLIAFALAIGREWGPLNPLIKVAWTLLALALTKSFITFALLGPGSRPGLLIENNFELALFCGLFALLYSRLGRGKLAAVALLGLLTVLSGSRSGSVAFLLLGIYVITQAKEAGLLRRYLLACLVPLLGLVTYSIFEDRASSSTSIDRLNFLEVFLAETSAWTPLNWLFGTTPITPLSPGGCARLSYYESLLSSVGDGSCYSVILHAFNMRVVYDSGILGLALACLVAWYAMRRGGVQLGLALTLLMIAVTNGFSVSGLNNPYVALPILLAITSAAPFADSALGRGSIDSKRLYDEQVIRLRR